MLFPIALMVIVLPLLYLWFSWDRLPVNVPLHYDINGTPDRLGTRSEFAWVIAAMSGVSLFVFLLIWNIHKLDPKKNAKLSLNAMHKIALTVTIFICILSLFIVQYSISPIIGFEKFVPLSVGLLVAVLGNFMHSMKPNYFVGIRTPWTLENEQVWKETHQLGGKIWFIGGIVIALATLISPKNLTIYIMVGCIAIMSLVPIIYSYIVFRRLKNTNSDS